MSREEVTEYINAMKDCLDYKSLELMPPLPPSTQKLLDEARLAASENKLTKGKDDVEK